MKLPHAFFQYVLVTFTNFLEACRFRAKAMFFIYHKNLPFQKFHIFGRSIVTHNATTVHIVVLVSLPPRKFARLPFGVTNGKKYKSYLHY